MASLNVGSLGEYLREQRRSAELSLRQLAEAAGVSNPYLSQIERGLRKPSAEVLQQVAKALRISAETLYVRAGILDEKEQVELETRAVILADPSLNERQKQVLLQIYESFRKENASASASATGSESASGAEGSDAGSAGTGPAADTSSPADGNSGGGRDSGGSGRSQRRTVDSARQKAGGDQQTAGSRQGPVAKQTAVHSEQPAASAEHRTPNTEHRKKKQTSRT